MDPNKMEVEVRPRDVFKHYVHIQRPGDILQWSFYTRKKNIAFGLFYLYLSSQHPANSASTLVRGSDSISAMEDNEAEEEEQGKEMTISCEFVHEVFNQSSALVQIEPSAIPTAPAASTSSGRVNRRASQEMLDSERVPSPLGELVEVLPIAKYPSFESTVRGSIDAPISGTYVLVFDNSFSINTSKHLIFSVDILTGNPSQLASPADANSQIVFAGWMLKKKRRRMQGWSRRWFALEARGTLIYQWERDGPCKGAMALADCSLTKVPQRWLITLDSGMDTFHLKALSQSDYDAWTEKISAVRNVALEASRAPSLAEQVKTQLVQCERGLQDLKQLAREHDGSIPLKFVDPLESTLDSMATLFASLQEFQRSIQPPSFSHLYKSLHSEDDLSSPPMRSGAAEEDVFYDADEIVISDVSESDYAAAESGEDEFPSSREETEVEGDLSSLVIAPTTAAQYRTTLPVTVGPCTVSLASILRKSIGKDSSGRSMPVGINEPLSALQRMCEELEYVELLDKAAQCEEDQVLQMAYVVAYAVSAYSSLACRADRKPFNPMLGETFEWVDGDLRFVSEKVAHRPVTILACHAQRLGQWTWWQDQAVKSKNWGKSIEYIPSGSLHVQFEGSGRTYSWSKVISCLRNIWSSEKCIENYGDMAVRSQDGMSAMLNFKSSGFFGGASDNQVLGCIAVGDQKVATLRGRWDDHLIMERDGEEMRMLWKAKPLPPTARDYYFFSYFALRLNAELSGEEEKLVPITDSRRRPDQRLLEHGRMDDAEREKARIEEMQRKRRAQLEEAGEEWKPLWFDAVPSNDSESSACSFVFNNRYWEDKLSVDIPQLW